VFANSNVAAGVDEPSTRPENRIEVTERVWVGRGILASGALQAGE
jgi:hypothetical protein